MVEREDHKMAEREEILPLSDRERINWWREKTIRWHREKKYFLYQTERG